MILIIHRFSPISRVALKFGLLSTLRVELPELVPWRLQPAQFPERGDEEWLGQDRTHLLLLLLGGLQPAAPALRASAFAGW
eukprot:3938958-Rhodomonas_salina.4